MKIIQVTDLHLVKPGATLCGLDPLARLQACITDINQNHCDAELVIFTGDLSDTGEEIRIGSWRRNSRNCSRPSV